MCFRRLSIGGGNVKFAIFFEPVSEVELQIIHTGGGEIDLEIISFVDGGHIIVPVGSVDELVSGNKFELRSGFVAVDQHRAGDLCPECHILQLSGDVDRFIISAGHDGDGIPVFHSFDGCVDGFILLTRTHKQLCAAQNAERTQHQ